MSATHAKSGWELYQFPPAFVLGFHGCDASVGEAILQGDGHLKKSQNDYDWLGSGIYFWESNPQRALDFAQDRANGAPNSKGLIKKPFVVGAVINLKHCLDMRDSSAQGEVKQAFEALKSLGNPLPSNGQSLKLRNLDCAVFNYLHVLRSRFETVAPPYDTVRASYREGQPLYPGTDLCHQDHIQICVRNTDSILGYFRPLFR